ncbi:hypothetical protein POM88_017903 [Heracleum sosnowskyi]|uniref:DUF4283 domain-containing protein n=1 Tax=Heracleum sosnowskyi TaxID=360622 RepID=A0AAD8ITE1_9APIA|nr:hypothetical protein POM88_017903 [Heracleum sosnowskyi]
MFPKARIEGGFGLKNRLQLDSDSGFHNIITRNDMMNIGGKAIDVNLNSTDDRIDISEEELCDMNYHVEGFFAFTFDCEHSKIEALSMGFIILSDSVMIFKPWQNMVGFNYSEIMAKFVWITLSNIHISLLSMEGIGHIIGASKLICFEQSTYELEVVHGAKILIQLDYVNYKPPCFLVQIPNEDFTDHVQVPVRIVYHEISNKPLGARFYPKKQDQMLFGSSTFLGCPVYYDGLDYSDSEIDVHTSIKCNAKAKPIGLCKGEPQKDILSS